jgi:hypothetical protein
VIESRLCGGGFNSSKGVGLRELLNGLKTSGLNENTENGL